MRKAVREVRVVPSARDRARGTLVLGNLYAPCALGRAGITRDKREGDGATPRGAHRLVAVYYRPDRVSRPATALPVAAMTADAGWCDDPADRRYNRFVRLPDEARHERLWRADGLYDLLVVLDFNLTRPEAGRGSAIFLHLATPDFMPTAGCVAVTAETMRRLLAQVGPSSRLVIR